MSYGRISAKRAPLWANMTHWPPTPSCLAEKRIGFLLLTLGLVLYLSGLVLKSPEGLSTMVPIAAGVVIAGLVISVAFTKVVGNRIREQARRAKEQQDPDALPEQ